MPGEADISDIRMFRRLAEEARPTVPAARPVVPCWLPPLGLLMLDGLAGALAFQAPLPAAAPAGAMGLFLVLVLAGLLWRDGYGGAAHDPWLAARALRDALGTSLLAVGVLHGGPGSAVEVVGATATPLALAGLAILGTRAVAGLAWHATGLAPPRPRIVLIGAPGDLPHLMMSRPGGMSGAHVVGWIDDGNTYGRLPGLPRLGGLDRLAELARAGQVDQVVLATPPGAAAAIIRRCAAWPVEIRLARPGPAGWDTVPVLPRRATGTPRLLKRTEDLLLGSLLLMTFALPMALLVLAIRLDSPGPVLFRQRRTGLLGQPFEMFKFRTMRHDPAPLPGCIQAVRDDPRVTRLGVFLRRTSLDELPQLFNVLRGDMALVGPRPHAPGTSANGRPFEDVVPFYEGRHRVKPGITGLAQVRGLRGETRTEADVLARVEADYEYIARWSLGLDLLILLRTALAVLSMRNAY